MNQHYFVGISIPIQQALTLQKATNNMELCKTHKVVVVPEDMHITLMYLGAVSPHQISNLAIYMEFVSKGKNHFNIVIQSVQLFGHEEKPRVVYADIDHAPMLHSLQSELTLGATETGLLLDKKPFVPHITLAKKWSGEGQMQTIYSFSEPISFTVEQFSLFEIQPNQNPKYIPIATFPLGDR
ncbi:MAG: RNA 2',3'-cyclic phosphodiesterase [Paenisporosarcina sp.]